MFSPSRLFFRKDFKTLENDFYGIIKNDKIVK